MIQYVGIQVSAGIYWSWVIQKCWICRRQGGFHLWYFNYWIWYTWF